MSSDRRATYADLIQVPDTKVAEIVDGELVVSPRPALPHANATAGIESDLLPNFRRPPGERGLPGGWWLLAEPELHFDDDVPVPDLAGWRRERLPEIEDVAAITLAPDWVCEVISPRSAYHDRVRKMAIYAREGVPHAWLVDPLERTLEVFKLARGVFRAVAEHRENVVVRAEPFEAIELDLSNWWMRRR